MFATIYNVNQMKTLGVQHAKLTPQKLLNNWWSLHTKYYVFRSECVVEKNQV